MDNEIGFTKSIKNYLISLEGLPTVRLNDIVQNEQGVRGVVYALHKDTVDVLQLDEGLVQPGQVFKRQSFKLTVPTGQFLLGRAINPLGVPIDGKGVLAKTSSADVRELERVAPGIAAREFITQQFETGIGLIDTLMPIGKGQRELILGDARTGKANFLINIIVNQKSKGVVCIYASIGKPIDEVKNLMDILRVNNTLPYTIVIATSSSDLAPLIYLTPQTAFTIAEYFQSQGKDVLVMLDDMGGHAKIAREISLLGERMPGRESYPADIFYQQSHLLERAGRFNTQAGGGSITCLPVVEINLNDFTTFIPTNIMAMTDGHLLFKSQLYNKGQRPAIDIFLSVSRVGQQTQSRVQNTLSTRIKQVLTQAAQLETVTSFSFELPIKTQAMIKQKEILEELFKHPDLTLVPLSTQIVLFALPFTSYFFDKDKKFIRTHQAEIIQAFSRVPEFSQIISKVFQFQSDEVLIAQLEPLGNLLAKITNVLPPNENIYALAEGQAAN